VPSRIRVLSEAVANRIAAGEVIEGPHSVVKELIENALDAGADEIALAIKGGGSDMIRVADNGHGMGRDDALAALDRFATSKLRTEDDLAALKTLGFRGEALPSIASVSRVRLVTAERGSDEGTEVAVVGGTVRDVRPAARSTGTTLEVSSLFFNTPARRKFLKSDRVEVRKILELVQEYAVLYPDVRIDVSVDGKPSLSVLPAGELRERVAALVGAGAAGEMLPVEREADGLRLTGFAGKPSLARARGALQIIAVNRRPIRSRLLSAAVRSGYSELLPKDRHPSVIVLIECSPDQVDVNVHPTKREVRFGDTRKIFALVEEAIRDALLSHDVAPHLGAPELPRIAGTVVAPLETGELSFPATIRETPSEQTAAIDLPRTPGTGADVKFWQLHEKYVFVQTREGVMILDQHAAHERVMYEKTRRLLSDAAEAGPGQELLFPVTIELTPAESAALDRVSPLLAKLGFSVRGMSGRTVLLSAVPAAFPKWPHDQILRDILTDLPSGDVASRDLVDSIAATCACKASIRTGDRLTEEEMRALIDQLFATELPYACPHGRPTFMRITTTELDKRFGR